MKIENILSSNIEVIMTRKFNLSLINLALVAIGCSAFSADEVRPNYLELTLLERTEYVTEIQTFD